MPTALGMERRLSEHVPGFVASRRYAPSSSRHRKVVLGRFIRATGDPPAGQLEPQHCLDWWTDLGDATPATLHAYYRVVRAFVVHLTALGATPGDPLAVIQPPKVPRKDPVVLTNDETRKVIEGCRTPRELCIVALMLGCGLRAIDVSRLTIENIDLAEGVMRVPRKGGSVDDVGMPTAAVLAVRRYLDSLPAESGPLVRCEYGRGIGSAAISAIALRVLRRTGVKRCAFDGRSPHVMRRTCATELLDSGASIVEVQTQLGHASLDATQRYLARPEARRLRTVVERGPLGAA